MEENPTKNQEGQELKKLEEELKSIGTPAAPSQTPPPSATSLPPMPVPPETAKQPVNPEPKGSKVTMIALGFLVLSLVVVGAYFIGTKSTGEKACTLEAKICPDGSSVGRTGPNCEFAPCPTLSATPTPIESTSPSPSASGLASPTATSSSTPTATPSATPQ